MREKWNKIFGLFKDMMHVKPKCCDAIFDFDIMMNRNLVYAFSVLPLPVSGVRQRLQVNLDYDFLTLMWSFPFL